MECKDIRAKLLAYLEDGVSPDEKSLIEKHLLSCQACGRALSDLKKTAALVKGLDEVDPPAWMTQQVMARVRAEEEKKRGLLQKLFYPLHVKIPVQAFATVLIAMIAIYVFRAVEPQMKAVQTPLAPEQTLSRDEAPKPLPEPAPEPKGEGETTATKEPPRLAVRTDLARGRDEKGRRSVAEEKPVPREQKEELPAPDVRESVPAEQPLFAKKKEAGGTREEEQAALPRPPYAPAAAAREKEGTGEKDATLGEMRPSRALSAPAKRVAAREIKAAPVTATVHVGDLTAASGEVETQLRRLGAQRIERETSQGMEVITADLQAEKISELFDSLKWIGEVKEKSAPSDTFRGVAGIRIEIVPTP